MGFKKGSRLAACVLAIVLVSAPLSAGGATPDSTGAGNSKMVSPDSYGSQGKQAVTLDRAIALAREKVAVPADLDNFNSDYNEYGGKGKWVLQWSKNSPPDASMSVTVDAASGAVDSVNLYRNEAPGGHYKGLPKYNRSQCLKIARDAAAGMQPDRFDSTVYLPGEEGQVTPPLLGDRDCPVIYDFNFKRTYSGIPVNDQGISVGINADTGRMVRYDANWDSESEFPSPSGMVGPDQAKKIFMAESGFELTYYMIPGEDPDMPGKIIPAYRPKPPGNFMLNALTGKIMDDVGFYSDSMKGPGGMGGVQNFDLTPSEKKAVEENNEYISSGRAQDLAGKLLEIPDGMKVTGLSLERYYGVPGVRAWHISYQNEERNKFINVELDARTGEVLSFNMSDPASEGNIYSVPEVKVGEDQAKEIALDFIKKMQPVKSGQVVLRVVDPLPGPWVKVGKNDPSAYSVQFARVVSGIVYPENGFTVGVNSSTGQVRSYDFKWCAATFPDAGKVIGSDAADEKFLVDHLLKLEYYKVYSRWGTNDASPYSLVYSPGQDAGVMLDAVTGEEIDYQGKPVVKPGGPVFSDISGNPAEADIKLLAGQGIVIGDGGRFRPDDPVTGAEALAMLEKAFNNNICRPLFLVKNEPWYNPVIDEARSSGILDDGFSIDPGAGLTRLQLSRLGINAAGWGKLARVSRIFRLDTTDASLVPRDYTGYAAAALGLGLWDTGNGKFDPGRTVTRGEAATFLVKLLKQ